MYRYDLAGITAPVGIEDGTQGAHRFERGHTEEAVHVLQLVEPDAVLAGNASAGVDTGLHHLGHGDADARRLVRIVGGVPDVRVQVSITRMKYVALVVSVLPRHALYR